jgi:hypothetical protein
MATPRASLAPRARRLVGWLGAFVAIAAVALIVGRPGIDAEHGRATPTPPAPSPIPVAFGLSVDPVTGAASEPTTTFRGGDPFVYSATLPAAVGTTDIYVEVLRDTDGVLTQVQAPQLQHTIASSPVIVYAVTTDGLIQAFGTGTFVLRIYRDPHAAPVAEGRFRILPAPGAAPSSTAVGYSKGIGDVPALRSPSPVGATGAADGRPWVPRPLARSA